MSKSKVVLQWIDEQGNFHVGGVGYTSLYESLPSWAKVDEKAFIGRGLRFKRTTNHRHRHMKLVF